MWKDDSSGYIKNNRSSAVSVIVAAFISALLLSLLCGLFYNAWKYEVERIELEIGGWHSRIVGEFGEEEIEMVKQVANVKEVVRNNKETTMDIYFVTMGTVLEDSSRVATALNISADEVVYNHELLAMYLIRDPQDTAPRLLFPMFILIVVLASVSLIMIIHNSFAVSMNARVHQFGIFSSIGATPKQIRSCLLQEAAVLCSIPIALGNLLGILISMILINLTNILLGSDVPGRHEAVFGYHPFVLLVTMFVSILTVWISAWIPARKLSRLTPLEAIKNTGELQLNRKKSSPLLSLLFGPVGELAGNALKAQKRALRTASLSLIFSVMAFTLMQCLLSLSVISTKETYFERYKNVWDIMITVKDTEMDYFLDEEEIQGTSGVRSAIVYQKAFAKRIITENEMSEEMKAMGGFVDASGDAVSKVEGGWLVNTPIIILDDASFLAYCEQIGITSQLDGAIIRNCIRDVTNPDFRHPQYMPYVKDDSKVSILRSLGNTELAVEIPVLSYTEEVPVLREEYATLDYYELVHFVSSSLWSKIKGQIIGGEKDIHICVLGREHVTLEELTALQNQLNEKLEARYTIESENRILEQETNDKQLQGLEAIFGGFCALLAVIGMGNVFSNTLGFVRERKREFARYLSVGLTPEQMRKMFCIEAFVIAGRPILITIPLTLIAVWLMLKASYIEIEVFLAEAPWLPITVFMLSIVGIVALAYYLGWKNIRKIDLVQVLRDDSMM